MANITETSKNLFPRFRPRRRQLVTGMPLVGGNVGGSKEQRGNLTQLKRAGLILTDLQEGDT